MKFWFVKDSSYYIYEKDSKPGTFTFTRPWQKDQTIEVPSKNICAFKETLEAAVIKANGIFSDTVRKVCEQFGAQIKA